ncbi:MAG: hypothetical protein AB7O90_17645, partial [Hyphomicrobium sp.]
MKAAKIFAAFFFVHVCALMALFSSSVEAQQAVTGFDHRQTGFPLLGAHASADCESCHVGGQFKGTPHKCSMCHNGSRATGKPNGHPPTSENCEACHSASGWSQTRYDHREANAPCMSCHNGSVARGKPSNHVPTTQPCEACHKNTLMFTATSFDHSGITTGCASCHNGSTARGKPVTHVP